MLGPRGLYSRVATAVVAVPDAAAAADAVAGVLDGWQGAGEASDDRTLLLVRRRPA